MYSLLIWKLINIRIQTCHKDLQRVAQKCLGERHEEVLGTQKTAIAQLKQKVKDLELAKPPGSNSSTTVVRKLLDKHIPEGGSI